MKPAISDPFVIFPNWQGNWSRTSMSEVESLNSCPAFFSELCNPTCFSSYVRLFVPWIIFAYIERPCQFLDSMKDFVFAHRNDEA